MSVKLPAGLPAADILSSENITMIGENSIGKKEISPLKLAILNLMPTKPATETQLLRLLGNTALEVEIILLHPKSHSSKNTSPEHLNSFYHSFADIRTQKLDGLIITGAPIEQLEFEAVDYWEELREIMDWSLHNVKSTLHICWGAQAGLYHHYGIRKHPLQQKLFGVYLHKSNKKNTRLLQGFDDEFFAPHSRYTEVRGEDIEKVKTLELLAESEKAGVYIAASIDGKQIFLTGHPEYDAATLKAEYERDIARELPITMPENYFPKDDPSQAPVVKWRSHANLLFSNWLSYYVQAL